MHEKDPYSWAGLTGLLAALALTSQAPQALQQEKDQLGYTGEHKQPALTQTEASQPTEIRHTYTETALLASDSRRQNTEPQPSIDDFLEIALGAEWSQPGSPVTPRIRRWHQNVIHISVLGHPTEQDWRVMRQVSTELSQLTGMVMTLTETSAQRINAQASQHQPDIEIHFRPGTDFAQILPTYQPGNQGFAWVWWGEESIEHATILIESREIAQQGVSPTERSHLIREELTQSLGLMQDSWSQPDSIFYQGWTTTTEYSSQDKAIIQWLYQPQMHHNMTASDAQKVLIQLNPIIELTGTF